MIDEPVVFPARDEPVAASAVSMGIFRRRPPSSRMVFAFSASQSLHKLSGLRFSKNGVRQRDCDRRSAMINTSPVVSSAL
jgi:hypothetical protein